MTIKTWAFALTTVLVGWFVLQLLVMRFTNAAPGALVLFPTKDLIAQLPEGVAVVGAGSTWLTFKSDMPGLGPSLYASGAWIVLPAGLAGCIPLS
jgi:hypothetical protein